jgi:hypothetical protein
MSSDIKQLQRALNRFTEKRLLNIAELRVDGRLGPATKKRVRFVKYHLGWVRHDSERSDKFLAQLDHPEYRNLTNPKRYWRGKRRSRAQRKRMRASINAAARTSGVGTIDGKQVANWLIPYVKWARANGWKGWVVSGWRDPAYSEHLCRSMCGAPSCPGRCAGRASNHAGDDKPRGAIDVAHYYEFGDLMRRCPIQPRIFNALGARDPVHFSASGN